MSEILIDDSKYELWTPKDEEKEFHPMIEEHSKEIFGQESIYFRIRHKLKSESGIAAIPDAYVINLSQPYEWFIIENELSVHPVYDHIVPQVTKFFDNIEELKTQNDIRDILDKEISQDKVLKPILEKTTGQDVFRFLTELVSKPPRIIIVIDQMAPEVERASKSLKKLANSEIVVFQTFIKEDGTTEHAHLFKPLTYSSREKETAVTSIEQKERYMIDQIESGEVKKLLFECLRRLEQMNLQIKPLAGRWVSVWFKGKRFMQIGARHKFFKVWVQEPSGEWLEESIIRKREELEDTFRNQIEFALKKFKAMI